MKRLLIPVFVGLMAFNLSAYKPMTANEFVKCHREVFAMDMKPSTANEIFTSLIEAFKRQIKNPYACHEFQVDSYFINITVLDYIKLELINYECDCCICAGMDQTIAQNLRRLIKKLQSYGFTNSLTDTELDRVYDLCSGDSDYDTLQEEINELFAMGLMNVNQYSKNIDDYMTVYPVCPDDFITLCPVTYSTSPEYPAVHCGDEWQ